MPVDAVIFDIGNVLIEWQPERFYDTRIGPAARAAFFAESVPPRTCRAAFGGTL